MLLSRHLRMRLGDWSGEKEGEGYWLLAYLCPWLKWSVSSQGMPAGVGGWDNVMSGRKQVWTGRPVRSIGGRGISGLMQSWRWNLVNKLEKRGRSVVSLPASPGSCLHEHFLLFLFWGRDIEETNAPLCLNTYFTFCMWEVRWFLNEKDPPPIGL